MLHDLIAFRQAKEKLDQYEPFFDNLCKYSDYLFKNLHLPYVFDIIERVESAKIAYYIEINECKRILNSKASNEKVKLILITKGTINEEKK